MPFNGGRCRKERKKSYSSAANTLGKRRATDPAKALVMAYVERLARNGFVLYREIDSGVIELTLWSGEVFELGETSVTRII
jgi:hypothetical protein